MSIGTAAEDLATQIITFIDDLLEEREGSVKKVVDERFDERLDDRFDEIEGRIEEIAELRPTEKDVEQLVEEKVEESLKDAVDQETIRELARGEIEDAIRDGDIIGEKEIRLIADEVLADYVTRVADDREAAIRRLVREELLAIFQGLILPVEVRVVRAEAPQAVFANGREVGEGVA